ncbi:drug/metabolite transporter superfamily [Boletus edulis]|nr:drug/metabolite transporter superfamily [Boletus edulis]
MSGYLPLSQEHDGPAPANIVTPWWAAQKAQVDYFLAENAGLLLVICSQFAFASAGLCVKLLETLEPPTPTLELMTLRMLISFCCCTVYMLANGISNPILGPKGVRGLLSARALVGFFGIFGMYYSLNYLSISDAVVITFLNPFAVALAGYLLLKETYTKQDAMAGVCSLIGVVLIARPTFLFGGMTEGDDDSNVTSFERLRAVGVALIGICGNTGTFITMRAIGTRAHPIHVLSFFSIFCIVVGPTAMTITHEPVVFPMTWNWIVLLLILGFSSIIGQLLLTVGLHYETATRGSLGSFSELIFAAVLQFVVFGTVPPFLSVAGAAIIISAQVYAVSPYLCRAP